MIEYCKKIIPNGKAQGPPKTLQPDIWCISFFSRIGRKEPELPRPSSGGALERASVDEELVGVATVCKSVSSSICSTTRARGAGASNS